MNTYRHTFITQTLVCLRTSRTICFAALRAHLQQGPRPPLWRPVALYRHYRRQKAFQWLQQAMDRSLQGHLSVTFRLLSGFLPPNTPDSEATAIAYKVRERWLTTLLEHTDDPAPNLAFEDFIH